jgi:hypothetical protein
MRTSIYILKRTLVVGFLILLSSCNRPLSPEQYVAWMENEKNGLHKTRPVGELNFELQFYTPELMYLQSNEQNAESTKTNNGIVYCGLVIRCEKENVDPLGYNAGSTDEYYQRQSYFAFAYKNDVVLKTGANTYPCEFLVSQNIPGMQKELKFLMAFDIKTDPGDLTVQINDRVFGGGYLQFKFKRKDIKNIPNLKLPEA